MLPCFALPLLANKERARFRAFSFLFILVVSFLWGGVKIENMDPDSLLKSGKQQQNSDHLLDAEHVLPAFRLRCAVSVDNEMDRFLLDYGHNFLPYIGLLSWFLFLLCEN
jgi:hypothetical protein